MRTLTIIVMACLLTPQAYGKDDCRQDLTIPRDWLAIEGDLFPPGPKVSTPTVKAQLASAKQQAAGIKFIVKRIKNWPWLSTHSTFGTDIQGDPRAPFILFGTEVAQLLGFDMPDENTIHLPTATRLNSGIEQLNSNLPMDQKIQFRFYEQNAENRDQYLQMIAQGYLPVSADREQVAVHDYSFHVAAILLSQAEYTRILGMVRDIALPFIRSTKDKPAAEEARIWWETELDQALGFPTLMLGQVRSMREQKPDENQRLSHIIAYSLGLRAAPQVRLQKVGTKRYDMKILNVLEPSSEMTTREILNHYLERRQVLRSGVRK